MNMDLNYTRFQATLKCLTCEVGFLFKCAKILVNMNHFVGGFNNCVLIQCLKV